MKYILVLIVLVVAGGTFFYMQQAEAPTVDDGMSIDSMQPSTPSPTQNTGDSMSMEANPTVTVDIAGVNFEFDKKEVRVKEGDIVQINFTSTSGFHDWVVDEFSAATAQVRDGGKSSVTFVADKKGTFEYYCSVGKHRAMGMVGKLIVE